jgi:hypothetical protein
MNSKLWIKKATSMTLMVAIFATYSMVALAAEGKATGELIVNGTEQVVVNGESAQSGRTIFTSSIIETPAASSATINLGKAGTLELAPSSVATVSFNSDTINLELASGKVTVLNSINGVGVAVAGKTITLNAGETATARQDDDDDTEEKDANWLPFALIFGGAVAGLIFAATRGNNDAQIGGNTVVISPNR